MRRGRLYDDVALSEGFIMLKCRAVLLLTVLLCACTISGSAEQPRSVATLKTASASDDAIVPFKIHVPDSVLRDLKERLARTRFPDEIEDSGWAYGANLQYMKELVAYWRDKYDWRKQEAELNKFNQFMTNIDGLHVHFIHQRSPNPNAMPLISLQGYPSSFSEYAKVIGPLTDPVRHGGKAEDAFHFVTFSLPGIGFTEKPTKSGPRPSDAVIAAKLMARLGYTRYAVQGGDAGAGIGRSLALDETEHVIGLHLNFCMFPPPPGDPKAGVPEAEWKRMVEREERFRIDKTPWLTIQQGKPQTIGYALADSPVGQAAWLVDNWRNQCDCDGDPDKAFTKDEILTNIMIYWVSETDASSVRRYGAGPRMTGTTAVTLGRSVAGADNRRVEVPTACAIFPKDAILSPRRWVEARVNLTRWTEMPRGGHFAPLEQPALFVDDVRAFFRTYRK
jgi:pimeloyl-ACP methyl ester carboxylesterase